VSGRLAWGLVALALLLILSATGIALTSGAGVDLGNDVFIWAIAVAFAAAGVLIASRQPGNAIGWLFLGAAVGAGLGALAGSYADYWVDSGAGSETLGKTAAWYEELDWMSFILVPVTFLLLLFPDGRLPSPRWRPIAWCAGLGIAGSFVAQGLHPGRLQDHPQVRNPYGVDSSLLDLLEGLAVLALLVGVVGSAVSLIVRYRRARHPELRYGLPCGRGRMRHHTWHEQPPVPPVAGRAHRPVGLDDRAGALAQRPAQGGEQRGERARRPDP
jgi:hypothetical protein